MNGIRLHYLEWDGDKKQTMLLLHGFTGHAHVWDFFVRQMKKDYHIISLDQRGHGDSEWSRERAYSMDDHFSDISLFVDSQGMDHMILVGHSMGGRNALFYAACMPEKIDRLILVDSRIRDNGGSCNALMELLRCFPLQADTIEEVVGSIRGLYPLLPLGVVRHLVYHGCKQTLDGKYIPKYDTRMARQCQESGYSAEDLDIFLKSVSAPTLLVRGENSPFLSREDAERTVERLPNGILREISHSSHMPAQENPDEFIMAVREFLKIAR